MNRYENGKIYKIVDVGYNLCYIGSTCEKLSKRMERHRGCYNLYLKDKTKHKSMTSFKIFDEYGVENCKIELIENYECANKEELLKREGKHIQENECVNRCVAGRTSKEYKEYYNPLNEDKIKQGLKDWYERTKEDRKDKNKEYRDNHKEEAKEYNKIYRENNKTEIKQRKKEYYERDKFNILAKAKEQLIECEICNCKIKGNNYHLIRHNKTSKHIDNMEKKEEQE